MEGWGFRRPGSGPRSDTRPRLSLIQAPSPRNEEGWLQTGLETLPPRYSGVQRMIHVQFSSTWGRASPRSWILGQDLVVLSKIIALEHQVAAPWGWKGRSTWSHWESWPPLGSGSQ